MNITVLSGGVGGARFTRGLLALLRDRLPDGHGGTTAEVTVVANTGDDMWLHGVRVCPDLDTLMYTLGGAVHEDQGWGRRDETSRVSADLAAYDVGWEWFTLGDLDLASDGHDGGRLERRECLRRNAVGGHAALAEAFVAAADRLDGDAGPLGDLDETLTDLRTDAFSLGLRLFLVVGLATLLLAVFGVFASAVL